MGTPVSLDQHLTGELFKSSRQYLTSYPSPRIGPGADADLVGGQVPMGVPGVTRQLIEFHHPARYGFLP
jgi:hypothetical protein